MEARQVKFVQWSVIAIAQVLGTVALIIGALAIAGFVYFAARSLAG